jgi:hypothetical protein
LVELLIDRVVVVNEEVEIRYVIPTSPRGEHHRFCQLRTDYLVSLNPPSACTSSSGISIPGSLHRRKQRGQSN